MDESKINSIDEYKVALKNHDWFYEYSDDFRYYTKGRNQRDKLLAFQKEFDIDQSIWKTFEPK